MNRMNKLFISVFLMFAITCSSVFAAFPSIKYNASEKIEITLNNLSDICTISADNASYSVLFHPKTVDESEYVVQHRVNEGKTVINNVTVPTATDTIKVFNLDVDNGIHELYVSVSKNGNVLKEFKETIYVMDVYEHQFMDELSGRGACVHMYRDAFQKDYQMALNLLQRGGYKIARDDQSWIEVEKSKGRYDFSSHEKRINDLAQKGIRNYNLIPYGNGQIYPARRGFTGAEAWPTYEKSQPQTHDSIWAYAKYVVALAENFGEDIIAIEPWNEPNHYTAEAREKAQIYVDFVKAAGALLLYTGNDEVDLAPFSLAYNDEIAFVQYSHDYGLWPYFDSISHHPYVFDEGFTKNRLQEYRMKQIEDIILEHGGWKDRDITEIGFPTTNGSNTPSEESTARDISKLFTVSENYDNSVTLIYDIINDGTRPDYTEDNFGQVTYDYKPKPSYLATATYNLKTMGGVLVGEIDVEKDRGTRAFMFYKDGKPVVLAWSSQTDDTMTVDWFLGENESVKVTDKFGNVIASNTNQVTLGDSPVYIENLSDGFVAKAAQYEISYRGADWIEKYGSSLSESDLSEIKSIIEKAKNDFVDTPTAEKVQETSDALYNFGLKLPTYKSNGEKTDTEVSVMLYELFRILQRVTRFYATVYDGGSMDIVNRYDQTREKAKGLYKNNMQMMQYSEQILRHAMNYNKDAKKVKSLEDNPNKAGVVRSYDMMAEYLCGWFDEFTKYEDVIEVGYIIQTPYYDRRSFVNTDINVEVNLDNYSKKDFSGTIQITDTEGNVVSESPQLVMSGEGGHEQIYMTVKTERPKDDSGFTRYYISYVDNVKGVVHTQPIDFEVKDKFKASTLPATETVNNLDKVSLKVENVTEDKAVAHIKLKSDENFEFAATSIDVEIEGKTTKIVDIPIASIRDTKYHFYTFSYEITDDNGNVVASDEVPMSFTAITKALEPIEIESWDGDISVWEDAYPIYINTPKKPSQKESWIGAECSTRAFVKWDKENLYILADVYDERYLQEYNGQGMWQGDCIQIALDPKNDGRSETDSYRADDYELGFSVTSNGTEYYAWTSPNSLPGGNVDWIKIIRNDDLMITRYLVKLDKSIISTLDIVEGTAMALNIAVNDADILGRENYYQFTLGLADEGGKNPDHYADFVFSNEQVTKFEDGSATSIFPQTLEATQTIEEIEFSDISGHWAEETIVLFKKNGYVDGTGNNKFEPDKKVTRAEYIKMLSDVAGFAKEGYSGNYLDVNADDWFATYIQALDSNKMLPENMISEGNLFPNKEMTREEAAYLAMNLAYLAKMKTDIKYEWKNGEVNKFADATEVSEWILPMLNIAIGENVLVGSDDGNLYPKESVTRAEAVALLKRAMIYLQ